MPQDHLSPEIMFNVLECAGEGRALMSEALSLLPEPFDKSATLAGCVAAIATAIRDDHWREMMAHADEPCGKPGCNCHIPAGPFLRVLDGLRSYHRARDKQPRHGVHGGN